VCSRKNSEKKEGSFGVGDEGYKQIKIFDDLCQQVYVSKILQGGKLRYSKKIKVVGFMRTLRRSERN